MPHIRLTHPRLHTPHPVMIFDSVAELGDHVAARILQGVAAAKAEGRHYLLGCPSGRSPRPVYQAIAARLREEPQDLSHLVLVMMDEYLLGDSEEILQFPYIDAHFSCRGFAAREIVAPWNAGLPAHFRIADVRFPDPKRPAAFDEEITAAGGIDFFILASGAGDGHVAFNPPGSPRHAGTRVVRLAPQTRRDNLATFPAFPDLAAVPQFGVTVGIATIAEAREACMILTGNTKSEALARITDSAGYDPLWPATIVNALPKAEILADRAALPPILQSKTK